MTILYRRFLLVAALIAAMGAITANVIQETRTVRTHQFNAIDGVTPGYKLPCHGQKLCTLTPGNLVLASIMNG